MCGGWQHRGECGRHGALSKTYLIEHTTFLTYPTLEIEYVSIHNPVLFNQYSRLHVKEATKNCCFVSEIRYMVKTLTKQIGVYHDTETPSETEIKSSCHELL